MSKALLTLRALETARGFVSEYARPLEVVRMGYFFDGASPAAVLDEFCLNPTAEVLGYLYGYGREIPADLLARVSERVMSRVSHTDRIEMHELLCCLRLLRTEDLPSEISAAVRDAVTRQIGGMVGREGKEWQKYGLRPLQVADHPESPFLVHLKDAVEANLDHEIASQNEDGSWSPTWSWGDVFPEEWNTARRQWSGIMTLETLLALKKFNRIEGRV